MVRVSVIIPTYCESATIAGVLEAVHDELSAHAHELLVVDDSPDSATAKAAAGSDIIPNSLWRPSGGGSLRIFRGPGQGLGPAVVKGFQEAQGDRLVVMDGDGQHPATAVPELTTALEDVDVAVGSRHAGGTIDANWSPERFAMSFGASCIAWTAVPESRPLQDPMSGLFGVRSEVVAPVLDELDPRGYKILLEVLARSPVASVAEVPVEFRPREAGESNTDLAAMARYVTHMAELAIASRRRAYPDRSVVSGGEHA